MLTLPDNFWIGVAGSVIFGTIGISLLLGGYKLFDWMLPHIDFQAKLKENPIALAIVIGTFFLALSHIVASCVQ